MEAKSHIDHSALPVMNFISPDHCERRGRKQSFGKLVSETMTRRLRVTVVDDKADAAVMLAMLLETEGHQVQVEHDPWVALERSLGNAPDVFLLDIGLPGMDGNELAQRLRAQPETAKLTLIAVTGYGQENDRDRTRQAGFDHHLVKPIDAGKLFSILAAVPARLK